MFDNLVAFDAENVKGNHRRRAKTVEGRMQHDELAVNEHAMRRHFEAWIAGYGSDKALKTLDAIGLREDRKSSGR